MAFLLCTCLSNLPVSCRFGKFLVLPGKFLGGPVRICTHISKNLGWGQFLVFFGSLLYIVSKYVSYFCFPHWVYFIVCWFSWPLSRASAYCRVPMGSRSSDRRSICIWRFDMPCIKMLFTKLSSSSSQLHSAVFWLIQLWIWSNGSLTSCLLL